TGKLAEFAPHARVVHIDGDACEIGKLRVAEVSVAGNLATSLNRLAAPVAAQNEGRHAGAREAWRGTCRERAARHGARYDAPGQTVYAPTLLKRLSELAPDAIVA